MRIFHVRATADLINWPIFAYTFFLVRFLLRLNKGQEIIVSSLNSKDLGAQNLLSVDRWVYQMILPIDYTD